MSVHRISLRSAEPAAHLRVPVLSLRSAGPGWVRAEWAVPGAAGPGRARNGGGREDGASRQI